MNRNKEGCPERKSSLDYWDENWRRARAVSFAGLLCGYECYVYRRIDQYFERVFANLGPGQHRLIEIGAGSSAWLPRLNRNFGFAIEGLDYSPTGCERARQILKDTSVPGEIHQADMFEPPQSLIGRFDVVCSFGLVEHFSDTTAAVAACAAFVRPGGLVITMIPNMKGLYGWLYRFFDRQVFDLHVPLSLNDLEQAHRKSGLSPISGEYIVGLPGVIDRERVEPVMWRRVLRRLVARLSAGYWWLEERGIGFPENRITSPYLVFAAKKVVLELSE